MIWSNTVEPGGTVSCRSDQATSIIHIEGTLPRWVPIIVRSGRGEWCSSFNQETNHPRSPLHVLHCVSCSLCSKRPSQVSELSYSGVHQSDVDTKRTYQVSQSYFHAVGSVSTGVLLIQGRIPLCSGHYNLADFPKKETSLSQRTTPGVI
jgi:hypothetical protein